MDTADLTEKGILTSPQTTMDTTDLTEKGILTSPSPPSPEPGTILLETERLMLRRYTIADAPAMSKAANDAAVVYNLTNRFPHPYTLEVAEEFLKSVVDEAKATENYAYPQHNGLFIKPNTPDNPSDEPVLIGAMGIVPLKDVLFRTWQLGYWIAQPAWGKGYATEAVKGFTRWIFETWPGLNRIEALTYSRNLGSQQVLKKSGFIEEGRKRSSVDKKGVIMDEVIFGLLRSDLAKE